MAVKPTFTQVNVKTIETNAIFLFRKKMKVSAPAKTAYQRAGRYSCLQNLVTPIINRTVMALPITTKAATFGVQFLNPMPFPGNFPFTGMRILLKIQQRHRRHRLAWRVERLSSWVAFVLIEGHPRVAP